MFQGNDQLYPVAGEAVFGSCGAAASEKRPALSPASRTRWSDRVAAFRSNIESRCLTVDLAPDLAEDIGSSRWFRGLATMLGLSLVAVSFWPDLTEVEAATMMPVDQPMRDEFRSRMVLPLALGADSGRHMGATSDVIALKSAPERPVVQFVATLGRGDSFSSMLQRAGVGPDDAGRVQQLVGHAMPVGELMPGTQFDITLGQRQTPDSRRPLERMEFRARFDLDLSVKRSGGILAMERKSIAVDATPLRIRGTVGSSLYRSARAAGAPLKAIEQYLRLIDDHVSLDGEIGPDDEFDIVIAYKRSAKGERQAGDLLYAGLEHSGKPRLQLMRWGQNGEFFEASGLGRQTSHYFQPVPGRLSSHFGLRRHPILGYRRMHSGVDYAARYGTPIVAVSDGVVSYSGRHGGHGNYVRIEHGNGLGSGYAHMSRIAVSRGTRISAGQVIGFVGSTGLSTGPHLHFEVYQGGRKINPLSVRFVSAPQIAGAQLDSFRQRLARIKSIIPGAALEDLRPVGPSASEPRREIDRLARRQAEVPTPIRKVDTILAAREVVAIRN